MEQKYKQEQEFPLASVAELSSSLSSPVPESSPVFARFGVGTSGTAELQFHRESESIDGFRVDLRAAQLFKLGPVQSVCISEGSNDKKEKSYSRGITIQFRDEEESSAFHCAFDQWNKEVVQGATLEISL
ncbi:hypothetical protein Pint_24532 [Pistacia integerrima]|uniref:Uncharacterized protein n=1 Tax=Pistacia integerrima TaxID=434235 RepID=A0ACC0YDZ9_9ROSI|nr:hypothetical protein Pint_24532 [Pistacia integerrima]